jgi:hypothetical protein
MAPDAAFPVRRDPRMTWWTHAEEGGSILVIPCQFQIMGRILDSGWNLGPADQEAAAAIDAVEPV